MRVRHVLNGALIAACLAAASALADPIAEGRARSAAFLAGDLAPIWADMTPPMRAAIGGLDAFEDLRAGLIEAYGEERELVGEEILDAQGHEVYLRRGLWGAQGHAMILQWAFDEDGRIGGFFIREAPVAAESRFLDYETRADLRLPFDGEWHVFWGGRTIEENYHAIDRAQRFAVDFLVMEDGASHAGDPAVLENYHCWGRPILAPAAGTVARAVGDLPDQPIGSSDPLNPAGNHVVLDLGNGEFAFLAHLRSGSLRIAEGDTVEPGDALGLCGNSGNTSEPHLHFHLQTTADLTDGEGLPAQFRSYLADGGQIDRAEPVRGEVVESSR